MSVKSIGRVRAKPRGSISGLQRRQEESASATQKLLKRAYETLLLNEPNRIWKKIELCRIAGLKSTVPLHSSQNASVLDLFNAHNLDVKHRAAEMARGSTFDSVMADMEKLSSLLAVREAERDYLLKENRILTRKMQSLQLQLEALRVPLRK